MENDINEIEKKIDEELPENKNKEQKIITKKEYSLFEFKAGIKRWLHIDDEEILDIVLAGMVAEKVGGDPLWFFLIAPPGGSKTELLRSFNNSEYFHHLSDMTARTLVSGLMIQGDEDE